jgi:MFS transporter, DHA1 family, multidrug resistance protein
VLATLGTECPDFLWKLQPLRLGALASPVYSLKALVGKKPNSSQLRLFAGRTNFILVLLSSFLLSLARGCVTPILPLYMNSINLSTVEVGASFSAWGFGTLCFEPLVGIFADRGGRKPLTAGLVALVAVFYAAFPGTTTLFGVVAFQFLLGMMFAGTAVLFRYTVPDTAPEMPASRAYGILGATYFAAAVAGSVIGGLLASAFGYAEAFYAGSVLSIVALVVLASTRFPAPPARSPEELRKSSGMRGNIVWLTLLASMAVVAYVALTLYLSLVPLVVAEAPYSASVLLVSLLVATFNLSVLIFYPLAGSLGASKPMRWILGGLLVGALAFCVPLISATLLPVFLSAILGGISFSMLGPLSLALFVNLVPRSRRGFAIGVYGAAEDIGIIVGPALFSLTLVGLGASAAFLSIAAINLIGFLAVVVGRKGSQHN